MTVRPSISGMTVSLLLSMMLIIAASLQSVHASLDQDPDHHHEQCEFCALGLALDHAPVADEFSLLVTLWQAEPHFLQTYFFDNPTPWFRHSRAPPTP